MCSSKANEELVSKLTESVAATSRQSGTSTRRAESSTTFRKPGQEEHSPELVGSSAWNAAPTS